ncbi:MAG: hypothetical protein AAF539_14520, partial [Planctomycetota bacterium]
LDTSGYVVLPIESSPLAIDASGDSTRSTAAEELNLVELLDERRFDEGKLIVEVRATARGLIPDLESLVESKVDGYRLAENEDSGVSVIEFDKESLEPVVLSERTWTLSYEAADSAKPAPTEFTFPEPIVDVKEVTYQQYVDADLEDVAASVSLVRSYGSNRQLVTIVSACSAAALLGLIALVVLVRSRGPAVEVDTPGDVASVTPFSLLTRLRTFESDRGVEGKRRVQLQTDIAAIESHFFAGTNGKAEPDLVAIADRWH